MERSITNNAMVAGLNDSVAFYVRLIEGAYIVHDRSSGLQMLTNWPRHIVLGSEDQPADAALVKRLAKGYVAISRSVIDSMRFGASSAQSDGAVARLLAAGWLRLKIEVDGVGWLAIRPRTTPTGSFPRGRSVNPMTVSRFLILHRVGESWLADAPHSWCDLVVSSARVLRRIEEAGNGNKDSCCLDELLERILVWSGVLVPEGSEDDTLERAQWSPHELWFHSTTRRYGRVGNYGGTFWASGRFDPPAFQPKGHVAADVVELDDFDETASRPSFGTLYDVTERRRSVRRHSVSEPITKKQLGDFLYRTMRLRALHTDQGFEYANKPYPSGGSAYEIETYLLVRSVRGVQPGLWRYDSQMHRLECIREGLDDPHVMALLRTITKSSTESAPPQVAVYLAPRFSRIMWKYEQIGYSVMLKNVGVVMAMMSLVATDMGLAYCAIGSGDSEAFCRAARVDPFECDSIGELILGTRGDSDDA
ncbi:SagB family peptide dehydrogenase [Actinomyces ruminicola]|uniref:SagB family peptide dehydrogenase n=1 Tax=Actinomyces ruminicola TaxID=332524 RepID=UPI001650817A|nr:SagB family peptide dehydrogenase [Actinomyces ruminicola]